MKTDCMVGSVADTEAETKWKLYRCWYLQQSTSSAMVEQNELCADLTGQ